MHTKLSNILFASTLWPDTGSGGLSALNKRLGNKSAIYALKLASAGLVLAVLIMPWSNALASNIYCYDEVCIDFSPAGSYHVITVTDVETSDPWLVQLTDVPSHLQPTHRPPGSGGQPPVDPYSDPAGIGEHLADQGPHVPPATNYEFSFSSNHETWIIVTTLIFGPGSELMDVSANVSHM